MATGDESRAVTTWRSSSLALLLRRVDDSLARQQVGSTLIAWARGSVLHAWATDDSTGKVSIDLGNTVVVPASIRDAVQSSSLFSPVRRSPRVVDVLMAALVASLPLGSYEVAIFSLPDILVLVTSAVLAFRVVADGALRLTRAAVGGVLAVTAVFLWMSVSTAVTDAPVRSLTQPFGHWLLLVVVVLYVKRSRDVHRLLAVASAAAVGVALLTLLAAVVQLPTEPYTIPPRTFGPVTMPVGRVRGLPLAFGILGMFMLYPAPYLALRAWQDHSLSSAGGFGTIVLAVVITQSRSTYLALVAAIAVLGVAGILWVIAFGPPRWRRRVGLTSVVAGLLSVPVILIGTRVLINAGRLNFLRRIRQLRGGASIVLERPLFGTGMAQFRAATNVDNVIHTAWFRLGVEVGLPALIAFVAAVYLGFRQLVRTATCTEHRSLAVVALAGAAAVAVEASFQGSFGRPTWVILGIAVTAPWRIGEPATDGVHLTRSEATSTEGRTVGAETDTT